MEVRQELMKEASFSAKRPASVLLNLEPQLWPESEKYREACTFQLTLNRSQGQRRIKGAGYFYELSQGLKIILANESARITTYLLGLATVGKNDTLSTLQQSKMTFSRMSKGQGCKQPIF